MTRLFAPGAAGGIVEDGLMVKSHFDPSNPKGRRTHGLREMHCNCNR